MRKLSFQEVVDRCNAVHNGKYAYDESTYNGMKVKMRCICPEHGEFWMRPDYLIRGLKCKGCPSGHYGAKTAFKDVLDRCNERHDHKYTYDESTFTGMKNTMRCICPEHGEFWMRPQNHIKGQKCPACSGLKKLDTAEFIRRAKELHGEKYDYSLTEYKNLRSKVTIICRIHGAFKTIAGQHIGSGVGCVKCSGLKKLTTEEFIAKAIEVHGSKYDYSKVEYKNNNSKVVIICPIHGEFMQRPDGHINSRAGCPKCANKDVTTEEFIEKARKIHGDKYDYSEVVYINAKKKLKIICPTHGHFMQNANCHLNGAGCHRCAKSGPSKEQIAMHEYLSKFTTSILEYKQEGGGFRYDMFLPEHNIAVEYNGIVWHCTKFTKDPLRDNRKFIIAQSRGTKMISIFSDEWFRKKDVVLAFLASAIGHGEAVDASECEITEIGTPTAYDFIKGRHIQGGVRSKVNLALTHNGAIVAVMSFNNPVNGSWELTRYCSTANIEGGPELLLKTFLEMPDVRVESVIAYSENRLCMDSFYENLGFKIDAELPPDYWYTKGHVKFGRKDKSEYTMEKLAKMFPGCDIENKTEREICEENGLYQIYDCGKRKWALDPRDLNPNNLTA